MNSTTFTTPRALGAMLKSGGLQRETRENRSFTNGGADAVTLNVGTIVTGGDTPAVFDTASPAAFTGLCLTHVEVSAGETVAIATLERGPAVVNAAEVDFPTDAPQTATLKAAMTAAGITLRDGLPSA